MRMFSEDETNHLFSSHNSLENNQVGDINEFMNTDSGTRIVSLIIEFDIIVFMAYTTLFTIQLMYTAGWNVCSLKIYKYKGCFKERASKLLKKRKEQLFIISYCIVFIVFIVLFNKIIYYLFNVFIHLFYFSHNHCYFLSTSGIIGTSLFKACL